MSAPVSRPWSLVMLTALGAWLSLLPLMGVLALLFGEAWRSGPGPYVFGALLLGGGVTVVRSRGLSLFVEQLAWPVLLLGLGALTFGYTRDLSDQGALLALGLSALGLSTVVPQRPFQAMLGAAALALGLMAWAEAWPWSQRVAGLGWVVHGALWMVGGLMAGRHHAAKMGAPLAVLAWAQAVLGGMAVVALAALAAWSGMTMLLPAAGGGVWMGPGGLVGSAHSGASRAFEQSWTVWAGVSAVGAALAVLRAWRAWPQWHQPWWVAVCGCLLALAALIPGWGWALAALVLCGLTRRPYLAVWAALAALWVLGAFYYQLHWPLAWKALVLVAAGAVLGGLGWWGARSGGAGTGDVAAADVAPAPARRRLIWAGAVVALLGVNAAIWQKEQLIREGQPVFIALAPADPRSLMQGDFMTLAFEMPPAPTDTGAAPSWHDALPGGQRWHAVAVRDARGVATLQRYDLGQGALAPGEFRIQLTRKPRGWTVVTDAWFFAEGEAQRWQGARFGEFRIDHQGRALLVGLRGADLAPL
ncbi:MAG: GDYXXLXY domain-containing protein [Aquabacterium sp.]